MFAGGLIGALARAAILEIDASWPWPTLFVNLVGAFLLGWVVMSARQRLSPEALTFITVGVLGAFTTFSTFAAEAWDLGDDGWRLSAYLGATLIGGIACALGGVRLGRRAR